MKLDGRLLALLLVGVGVPASSAALDPAHIAETLKTGGVILVLAIVVWWLVQRLEKQEAVSTEREASLLNDLHISRGETRQLWEKRVDDLVQMTADYQAAIDKLEQIARERVT